MVNIEQNTLVDARDVFFGALLEEARKDKRIFLITIDMGASLLDEFPKDQFLNIGVREQLAMSFAAGMAHEGYFPYVYGIASFMCRRAYEQIFLDIGVSNMPVTIVSTGWGKTYVQDGPTHWCEEDMSLMELIPHMERYDPTMSDVPSRVLIDNAQYHPAFPRYVRLPRGEIT